MKMIKIHRLAVPWRLTAEGDWVVGVGSVLGVGRGGEMHSCIEIRIVAELCRNPL